MKSRLRYGLLFVCTAYLFSCTSPTPPLELRPASLEAYTQAHALVEQALAALGGPEALRQSGGLSLTGEGTYDLRTRMQGLHPDRPEPVPLVERVAVDLAGGQVAYESHAKVNSDADEWIRYVYDGEGRLLFLDLQSERAFWIATPGLVDQKQRNARMVPHLLLDEALTQRQTLRALGSVSFQGALHQAVHLTLPSNETLMLFFDPATGLLAGLEYLLDIPLLGDTPIRWAFDAYQPVEGLGPYPAGYRILVGDNLLKEVRYTNIQVGTAAAEVFTAPPTIEVPAPPTPPDPSTPAPPSSAPPLPEAIPLGEGVYEVRNIRSGFHMMFVEFDDYALVVDAPAGYFELQQIPAMNWAAGETSSSVGRRLLRVIQETLPGKPVRYVVLSHHHSDHAGGLRPFIEAGATILTNEATRPVVERAVRNTFTLVPDELTGRDVTPVIEVVTEERTISDGTMEVRLLNVGPNPHAEGLLVAYLPRHNLLYQSDLFEPLPERFFPSLGRVPVMKWFVDWLDRSGLDPDQILAIHGAGRVTEQQLAQIRALDPSP